MNGILVVGGAMPIDSKTIHDGLEPDLVVPNPLRLKNNQLTKVSHPFPGHLKYFDVTDRINRRSPDHLAGRVPRCLPGCVLDHAPDLVPRQRHPDRVPVASH